MEYKIEKIQKKYHIHILDSAGCVMGKSFYVCKTEKEAIELVKKEMLNDDVYNMNQITNYNK